MNRELEKHKSEDLHTIFNKYDSDKNSKHHNYSRQYEDLLKKYRNKNISLLEIGVHYGESLKIWGDTFSFASKIVGIDIKKNSKNMKI